MSTRVREARTRTRWTAQVLLSVVAALVIAACAAASPAIAVPTLEPEPAGTPQACPAALIEGILRADEEWGIVLEATDGAKVKVLWPHGYSARVDDGGLALIDEDGSIVAHAGDLVQVGGGGTDAEGTWVGCGGVTVIDAG
jgi:hypothetical protein